MDSATLVLLAIGLFIAWVIGPAAVLHYRIHAVHRRFRELCDRFMSSNQGETLASTDDRQHSGAWHYARMLDPDVDLSAPGAAEKILHHQFWRFHDWKHYLLPLTFVILLSALMLSFTGLWLVDRLCSTTPPAAAATSTNAAAGAAPGTNPLTKPAPDKGDAPAGGVAVDDRATGLDAFALKRIPPAFVMALWGAYVWSLYEILSRRKSGDLTPIELYDIAARYVTAIPVGYAFSLLAFNTVPALAAFAISAFPLRDIRQFFRKHTLNKLDEKPATLLPAAAAQAAATATVSKGYLGDTLNGMGNDTIARLEELNIETYLDLAYVDPIKLMIRTGAPIDLVLSWIDQAMVSVYAPSHKVALALYGMPCSLDICEFYVRHCWNVVPGNYKTGWQTDPAVVSLAAKLDVPESFLVQQILRGIYEDPHTKFLVRIWFGPAKTQDAL